MFRAGALVCYHAETGNKIWEADLIGDQDGKNIACGYSMPVLIDDDKLYCSPGGTENNIDARMSRLNRNEEIL